jgi:hypothetical protein
MLTALNTDPASEWMSRYRSRADLSSPLRVSPLLLPSDGSVRREPRRPAHLRGPDFEIQYDWDTLFYDHFCSAAGNEVVLLGPDFCNLAGMLRNMEVVALPGETPLRFRVRQMDRHGQIWIPVPVGTQRLRLRTDATSFELPLRRNMSGLFTGERVMFTLSRNNRLEWIEDWVRFHRDVHGATAVLVYDNASTRYSSIELADVLAGIGGIRQTCVVDWPFRYGPQGGATRASWDSDYCQAGALEHARHYFLAKARSVLNADIDELVVSSAGRSVFEAAEASLTGMTRFHGVWVPGLQGVTADPDPSLLLRYTDFFHHLKVPTSRFRRSATNRCPTKWAVVPSRCPPDSQWTAHSIKRWPLGLLKSREFNYRHFREINDHWKYDRSRRESFDPARHVPDTAMLASFARVRWAS